MVTPPSSVQGPYLPRIVDAELDQLLLSGGSILIEGPKACGKTASARRIAASEVLLDIDDDARLAAQLDPTLILEGPSPRLIDEWQLVPRIWNHVRRASDEPGRKFILTGSATPLDDPNRHTGAGRIDPVRMRPMSLFESGHSTGDVSLAELVRGQPARAKASVLKLPDVIDALCVGGWPGFQTDPVQTAIVRVGNYLDNIARLDISRLDNRDRDHDRVIRLLYSLGRNVATSVSIQGLADDAGGAEGSLARDTVRDYLTALKRLMIIEDQTAWGPHLRSKSVTKTASKRHFVDPSLAVAATGASPSGLLKDLNYLGFLFESLVVRDLRIYSQAAKGTVRHYQDSDGLEVDTIVTYPSGEWFAGEVKLGGEERIDQGAASLLKFADRVDTSKIGPPTALVVFTAVGFSYVRPDGIAVVPVTTLKH